MVADAVYANPHDREGIAAAAHEAGVPFTGLWIEGPPETFARRLHERVADASDATVDVLGGQLSAGVGRLDWHALDGSRDVESVRHAAETYCRENHPSS